MDRELYMLRIQMQTDFLFHRIKMSREEIEENHPNRKDLIKSMTEAQRISLEACEFIRLVRDEWGILERTLSANHLANIKLEAEVRELRQKNASLMEKITL